MHPHIRYVSSQVELIQEITLLGIVEEIELVVRTQCQTVVVRLSVVTAHDTFLCEVAQREIIVNFLRSTADGEVMLLDRCIVVEE